MKVSVITPVYNAAEFITRSVESALAQPETAEVLLIEDGSPDESLSVCQELANNYGDVILLRHPNGENRGPGASRNLGMRHASCEYIAFVDADNFYLPNRFAITKEIFRENPDCDGVYETIGNYIENEVGMQRWINSKRIPYKLTGLTRPVAPQKLAETLISGELGSLTLDALVIKKPVLSKSGLMSEQLRLHQDTEFIIRVALVAKLMPADLSVPVALRGVHDHNRLSAPRSQAKDFKNHMLFWHTLLDWVKLNSNQEIFDLILKQIVSYTKSHKVFRKFKLEFIPARVIWAFRLIRLIAYPEIISKLINRRIPLGIYDS
jgi:glycosyltransferase involved in cell wall biosynthesis